MGSCPPWPLPPHIWLYSCPLGLAWTSPQVISITLGRGLGQLPRGAVCGLRTEKAADPRVALTHRLGPRLQAGQNRAPLEEPVWVTYQKGLPISGKLEPLCIRVASASGSLCTEKAPRLTSHGHALALEVTLTLSGQRGHERGWEDQGTAAKQTAVTRSGGTHTQHSPGSGGARPAR